MGGLGRLIWGGWCGIIVLRNGFEVRLARWFRLRRLFSLPGNDRHCRSCKGVVEQIRKQEWRGRLPLAGFVFLAIIFQEKHVREFRVTGASPDGLVRERRIRIALWCAVIFLAGLALFAIFGGRLTAPRINIALAWIAGCAVIGTIVCANFLAFDHGVEKVKGGRGFFLTARELVAARAGRLY